MIGKILGNRYEILEVVGKGGMAIVYKAKCRLLNRFVAIKMLRKELRDDKSFVEKFRVEAQSAASLNHPNIVSVYDVGNTEGVDYFVMEYIDGITLKERIEQGKIDWKTACEYAVGICEAIEHAHSKNIVHRDIKPHNIMITNDNVVKVTDFGIARAVSSSTLVRAGNVIGSVHYFSPEQACGGIVDFKSDIYSIGVVLYEMLTGRVPFDAENPVAVAKMHVDKAPAAPKLICPDIPESVSDIVLKAMAKQPAMRYQTAALMAVDLKKAAARPESLSIKDEEATQFIPVIKDRPPVQSVYEEETPEVKKSSKSFVGAWIAAVVIFLVAAGAVVAVFNPGLFLNKPKMIDIPDLKGMNYEEAKNEYYKDADFEIVKIAEEVSDKYEEGEIMAQNPEAGQSEKTKVEVTVSKGKDSITLDNYVGEDVSAAQSDLRKKGFSNIKIEYEEHEEYPKDAVFKMSPGKGSNVKSDTTITLYVSTGKKVTKIKCPKLVGLDKDTAINTLEAVGLKYKITEDYSDKPAGQVISQVIAQDTELEEGTAVSFTVSIGPKSTPEPSQTPISSHVPSGSGAPTSSPVPSESPVINIIPQNSGGQ